MIENSILPLPQLSQTFREWPLIWQPVWYAELPAHATTPLWSREAIIEGAAIRQAAGETL